MSAKWNWFLNLIPYCFWHQRKTNVFGSMISWWLLFINLETKQNTYLNAPNSYLWILGAVAELIYYMQSWLITNKITTFWISYIYIFLDILVLMFWSRTFLDLLALISTMCWKPHNWVLEAFFTKIIHIFIQLLINIITYLYL